MKRIITMAIATCTALALASCVPKEESFDNPTDRLLAMTTYESNATVTYKSDNATVVYDVVQTADTTGRYKIEVVGPEEVKGSTTVYNGDEIYQCNFNLSDEVIVEKTESPERVEILLTSFVENYNNTEVETEETGNFNAEKAEGYIVLDADMNYENHLFDNEKLWLDEETQMPVKLAIYNKEGKELVTVDYKETTYDKEFPDDHFEMPKKSEK